ncbi:ABC transporter ATP-binding protein [Anaeromyxobacter oryzisoli]|uniref:ABC transporter ATP-binding protein n=1 Tax=Anaeromyxobacter oryzisoli TaxID=2925408 RepID=UPI001F569445|nr:ABC transporter ATP-binding protein [Anaeromyxobacter sp. SG63]
MILRTEGLTKTFEVGLRRRRVDAVQDLTLSVDEGEIFGFVGPNGAGKTTTIKMLMGLIRPTRGAAYIFDAPIPSQASKKRIGYLPEQPSYYDFLTGREALDLFAKLSEVPRPERKRRAEELLELVGLTDAADRQLRKYSKGMQQRLGIAQALVADPAFVVLDEPMSGLDPIGRKEIRDLILELKRRGKTVFFSTHILPDVETICDRVGVIRHGRLREVGRLAELLSSKVRSVEVSAVAPGAARQALGGGRPISEDGERVTVAYEDEAAASAAVSALLAAGGRLVAFTPERETLEDFFMRRLEEESATGDAAARRAS